MHRKIQVVIMEIESVTPHVLLLRTNAERGNFWQNVTGSTEEEESFRIAAERELLEETGIIAAEELIDLEYCFQYVDQLRKTEVTEVVFLSLLRRRPSQIDLDQFEHDDYSWKPIDGVGADLYKYQSNYQAFLTAKKYIKYG